MQSMSLFAVLLVLVAASCAAFSPQYVTGATAAAKTSTSTSTTTSTSSTTALSMANDNDLLRWARSARTAGVDDRVVELRRPLGVVLSEDASGNVYVETVAARGNAARTGEVSSTCCMLKYMQSKEKSLELDVGRTCGFRVWKGCIYAREGVERHMLALYVWRVCPIVISSGPDCPTSTAYMYYSFGLVYSCMRNDETG